MEEVLSIERSTAEQDRRISATMTREQGKLRNFIRKRVADEGDAEDIFQEVFYELVQAYRLMKPVEQAGAWLYQVARNRIIDLFRKTKAVVSPVDDDGDAMPLEDLLPSPDDGPDALYTRAVLLEELDAAIDELPAEQREVFVAHEIDDRSFKEISRATGIGINTLLSRKRYAVLQLRRHLRTIYEEFENE